MPPQQGTLHIPWPLLLYALQEEEGTESRHQLVLCILHTIPSPNIQALPRRLYLEQSFKQCFVPVEVGSI